MSQRIENINQTLIANLFRMLDDRLKVLQSPSIVISYAARPVPRISLANLAPATCSS